MTTVAFCYDGVNQIPLLTRLRYRRNVFDPLTARTAEHGAREMTVEVLRYANRAKVAEALTSQGYEVTRATVNRWARGDEVPRIAQRMILSLFGHDPEQRRPANEAPAWATDLGSKLLSGIEANRKAILDQTAAQYAAFAERLLGADSADEGPRQSPGSRRDRPGPPRGR